MLSLRMSDKHSSCHSFTTYLLNYRALKESLGMDCASFLPFFCVLGLTLGKLELYMPAELLLPRREKSHKHMKLENQSQA